MASLLSTIRTARSSSSRRRAIVDLTDLCPQRIRTVLEATGSRVRWVTAVRALGRIIAGLMVVLWFAMIADFVVSWPSWLRWTGWTLTTLTLLVLVGWQVVWPLIRRLDPFGLAAFLDRTHPWLEMRLASAVSLLQDRASTSRLNDQTQRARPQSRQASRRPVRANAHGAPELIDALILDVDTQTDRLNIPDALPSRPAWTWLGLGMGSAALWLLLAVGIPDPIGQLAVRSLAPWSPIARVGWLVLDVKPGSARVVAGDPCSIQVHARTRSGLGWWGSPDQARLVLRTLNDDGSTTLSSLSMIRQIGSQDDRGVTFRGVIDHVEVPTLYRVEVDGQPSSRFRIEPEQAPRVTLTSSRIDPPPYTGLPPRSVKDPWSIEAWLGSRVALEIAVNRPAASLQVDWPSEAPSADPLPQATLLDSGNRGRIDLEVRASGPFAFEAIDRNGLTSRSERSGRVTIFRDQPPVVTLADAQVERKVKPDDVLSIEATLLDEFGIASAELRLWTEHRDAQGQRQRSELPSMPLEPRVIRDGATSFEAEASMRLSLAPLGLGPGDRLIYEVQALDVLPEALGGPNRGRSPRRTLEVSLFATDLSEQQDGEAHRDLGTRLEEAAKRNRSLRRRTTTLESAALAVRNGSARWVDAQQRNLLELRSASQQFVDDLLSLAFDFQSSGGYWSLAVPTGKLAGGPALDATRALSEATTSEGDSIRLSAFGRALDQQDQVQAGLGELIRRFEELVRAEQDRARLEALAARQRDLADSAEEQAERDVEDPAENEEINQLRRRQDEMARRIDDLLEDSPTVEDAARQLQAEQAESLSEQARALADRQRAGTTNADDQREMQREAARLARAMAQLRDQTRDQLDDDARELARNAADRLNRNVRQAMDQAQQSLNRDRDARVGAEQQEAADQLERAADEAEQVAEALRPDPTEPGSESDSSPQANENQSDSSGNPEDPSQGQADSSGRSTPTAGESLRETQQALNEARRALDQAARTDGAASQSDSLRDAAEAMRRVAQGLDDLATEPERRRGETPRSSVNPPQGSTQQARSEVDPSLDRSDKILDPEGLAELQATLRNSTGRTWGELPGHLQAEVQATGRGRARDDYARIIQLYFRDLAEAAAEPRPDSPANPETP